MAGEWACEAHRWSVCRQVEENTQVGYNPVVEVGTGLVAAVPEAVAAGADTTRDYHFAAAVDQTRHTIACLGVGHYRDRLHALEQKLASARSLG